MGRDLEGWRGCEELFLQDQLHIHMNRRWKPHPSLVWYQGCGFIRSESSLGEGTSPLHIVAHYLLIMVPLAKIHPPLLIAGSPTMPISMEQWRASVGSNNAARARVSSKTMNKCSSGSFLSQLLTYILALFTLSKRSTTGMYVYGTTGTSQI